MANLLIPFVLMSAIAVQAGGAQPQAQPRPTEAAPAGVELPTDYVIGPEDVLGVVFWREADISGDVTVRPDGRITLPVIGEMQAAGLRPSELQARIVTASAKYLAEPNVAVVVRAINSRRIFVTGRVTTPGAHMLKGPLDVMQALALAGGLTEYADAKNIAVLRSVNGRTERFLFNYKDVSRGKKMEQNILLLPGDTVVVP